MKKTCIFLCITVLMLSLSVVVFSETPEHAYEGSSLSAPAVCIIPAEKEGAFGAVSVQQFIITCGFSAEVCFRSISAVDKYTPEIMEQINIISVAPRE